MKKHAGLAIVFSILSFGAVQETLRIFTSSDADIADNRTLLMPMAVTLTGVFIFFAIRFWLKSSR